MTIWVLALLNIFCLWHSHIPTTNLVSTLIPRLWEWWPRINWNDRVLIKSCINYLSFISWGWMLSGWVRIHLLHNWYVSNWLINRINWSYYLMLVYSVKTSCAGLFLGREQRLPRVLQSPWSHQTCSCTPVTLKLKHTNTHCHTSGWKGWHDSGFFLSFWNFSLSHFSDSLCSKASRV